MPRPLKRGILGVSTIILSKDIDKYAFMCGSNSYESDVTILAQNIKTHARTFSNFYIPAALLELKAQPPDLVNSVLLRFAVCDSCFLHFFQVRPFLLSQLLFKLEFRTKF